jgi:Ran GTPase-activating protein (RanGAP) involved in mRNA processing and transport
MARIPVTTAPLLELQTIPTPRLQALDLGNNGGAMHLAPQIATLTALQHLNLSATHLSDGDVPALAPHLVPLTSLQRLDMHNNNVFTAGAAALGPVIACLSRLSHLNLCGSGLGDDGTATLAPHLAHHPTLCYLNLNGNGIGAAGVTVLLSHVSALNGLHLELNRNEIDASASDAIAGLLRKCGRLDALLLAHNAVYTHGAVQLLKSLTALPTLRRLDLNANGIGRSMPKSEAEDALSSTLCRDDALSAALMGQLPMLTALTYFDIGGNCFNDRQGATLTRALTALSGLRHLSIQGVPIRTHSLRALCGVLSVITSVTHLNIAGTLTAPGDMDDAQLSMCVGYRLTQGRKPVPRGDSAALAAVLAPLSFLASLDLSDNELTGAGGAAICSALRNVSGLTGLNLSAAGIGEGVEFFWPYLAALTSLRVLDLGANKLGSRGVSSFGAHASRLVQLQSLDLSENFFFGLGDLGSALASLTALLSLNLNANFLRDVDDLAAQLASMPSLRQVSAVGNPMTGESRATLAQCMAKARVHITV